MAGKNNAAPSQSEGGLFKAVEHETNFGISRSQTDPIYRMRDLLDVMQLTKSSENEFKARGESKNSKGLSVVLEFEFRATNRADAEEVLCTYKKAMIGKGLQIFLAFWKTANEIGKTCFHCPVTEIIEKYSSEDRKAYFNDLEREEFWKITRYLAATKFKLEWPSQKGPGRPRKNSKYKEWVEQPLVQIHGGEKELGFECPIRITATVLTTESAKRKFFPAIFSNATLRLHPSDIYFAVYIQIRAAQDFKRQRDINLDWEFTFKIANLEGTSKSNRRLAKARVRKKLGNFRCQKIIEDWNEKKCGLRISPPFTKIKAEESTGGNLNDLLKKIKKVNGVLSQRSVT